MIRLIKNNLAGALLITSAIYFASLIESADVLASILAAVILGISLIYLIYLLIAYFLIKAAPNFTLKQLDQRLITANKHLFNYQFSSLKLLPGVRLSVRPIFNQTKLSPVEIEFRTSSKTGSLSLTFPHHGLWSSDKTEYLVEDILGLFSLRFSFPNQLIFKVNPKIIKSRDLPVPSSADEESIFFNYSNASSDGDYYDMKKYHPADGLRKIIWKVFAKHGELISRHPEKINYLDETCVILYLGNHSTEKLAGTCLNYLRLLSREEVRFNLFSINSQQSSSTLEGAQQIILKSAWQDNSHIYKDSSSNQTPKLLHQQKSTSYLVFAKETDSLISNLKKHCKQNNISLNFCLQRESKNSSDSKLSKRLLTKLFWSSPQQTEEGEIVNA